MSTTKIVLVTKQRKGWCIQQLKEVATHELVKPLDSFPQDAYISSAISSKDVLVRPFEVPLKKEKEIFAALEFQAETLFPYAADKAFVQAEIIQKKPNSTQLTAAAIRKELLTHHVEKMQALGLDPETVTSAHFALAALSTVLANTSALQLMVHVGDSHVSCALVENGKLLRGYTFDADADVRTEIQKTVLSLASTCKSNTFDSILLLGHVDAITKQVIQETTGKTTHFPFSPLLALPQEDLIKFGLSIGIALVATKPQHLNFRKHPLLASYSWKRAKKPLALLCISSVALALCCFTLSHLFLTQHKQLVSQQFQALLAGEGKSQESPTTVAEYHRALSKIEQEVQARPDLFTLLPVVPRVSDVLNWLATSPHTASAIDIYSLHYTLVKRPDFTQKKEHYQVKVSLEFTAHTPSAARAFHDMLLSPNLFVDEKNSVQWTMGHEGRYCTSFYLKDKTRYL